MVINDNKKHPKKPLGKKKQNCDDDSFHIKKNKLKTYYHKNEMIINDNKKHPKKPLEKTGKFVCHFCNYSTSRKSNFDRHVMTPKHRYIAKTSKTSKTSKNEQQLKNIEKNKYVCIKCNFETSHKANFTRHLNSKKHKNNYNLIKPVKNNNYTCVCGKTYMYKSGLSRHIKKCKEANMDNSLDEISQKIADKFKEKDYFADVIKNNSNVNHTVINNTQNNQFNLKIFLNETCKDAMNLLEFVNSIDYNINTYKINEPNEVYNNISNIIIQKLQDTDITKRPIHCTDKKRNVIYIKDHDLWHKDEEKMKLKNAIDTIYSKQDDENIKYIQDLTKQNPEWKKNKILSNQIIKAAQQHTEYVKEKEQNSSKLLKLIIDNSIVDKNDI